MVRNPKAPSLLPMAAGALTLLLAARLDRQRREVNAARTALPRWRVVVLGGGFGGLNAAMELSRFPEINLTLIDAQNHHLFQPLLYQVATAALSPADIASALRDIVPSSSRTRVMMGVVTGIDTQARHVLCAGQHIPYDDLIIATGSQASYFGHDSWAQHAPSLKSLADALDLRGRILLAFEQACVASDAAERTRLLTFVVIGAGPTGVEMAGSIAEFCRQMLATNRGLNQAHARIVLVEEGKRVLAEFPQDLSDNAAASLGKLGVEIRIGARVTAIEAGVVHLGSEAIHAATIMWAAGTAATPVADWLGVKPGHGGRVAVGPDLQVAGQQQVHVIGDAALALGGNGKPLPGLAPVAKQQGRYVARAITRRLRGRRALAPFAYQDYGMLATIGRGKAVAAFGPAHVTGWPAWVLWAGAHIFFLIGFRNRLMVSAQWAFEFATNKRPGRLIAGRSGSKKGIRAGPAAQLEQPSPAAAR